jgi:uncharacterized protein
MEELIEHQGNLLTQVDGSFRRFLFRGLPWEERLLGIKGLRGVGKTTMLLQRHQDLGKSGARPLYATLDHPWFYSHTLLELAHAFHLEGGTHLLLDEIHKYPLWSRELKLVYDGYPNMQVVFTASSALEIHKGESDLSRRAVVYELPGLSFREFLNFEEGMNFPALSLADLLKSHESISQDFIKAFKPIPAFQSYLQRGYFPFTRPKSNTYLAKTQAIINQVLEFDLAFIEDYSASNQVKIKQLLGVVSESVPFQPNISALARKMGLGRDTVNNFLHHLDKGRIVNLLHRQSKGVAALQKPDKIYLENTNFSYALRHSPDSGSLRETFLFSQLRNAGKQVLLPEGGDFFIANDDLVIEVGGKGKPQAHLSNLYIASDNMEYGFGHKIPLWLFGFLY